MSTAALPVRPTDPDTSYAAAKKAALGASRIRPVVLEIVQEFGPITHDELIAAYHQRIVLDPSTPRASESGIRTRLKELVRAGLVARDTTEGVSNFGNPAKRWVATDEDGLLAFLEMADFDIDPQDSTITPIDMDLDVPAASATAASFDKE